MIDLIELIKNNKNITSEMILHDNITDQNKSIVDNIKDIVCRHYKINIDAIDSKCRKREIVTTRFMIYYMLRKYMFYSLNKISSKVYIKNKPATHATVLNGLKKIENFIKYDKQIHKDYVFLDKHISIMVAKLTEYFEY